MMTKQDMLTKLAIECATWGDVVLKVPELSWHVERELLRFTKQDWLAERERLLNKPSWDDAPSWATHLGTTGKYWHWLINACRDDRVKSYFYYVADKSQVSNKIISIPAGYDWKESLEERPE